MFWGGLRSWRNRARKIHGNKFAEKFAGNFPKIRRAKRKNSPKIRSAEPRALAWKSQLEIAIASDFPSHPEIAMWHCIALSPDSGKSTLWTDTGLDQNFQGDLGAIGPYEFCMDQSLGALFPGKICTMALRVCQKSP